MANIQTFRFILITISSLILPLALTRHNYDDNVNDKIANSCSTPSDQPGVCILINQCQFISDLVERLPAPISEQNKEFLKKYQCGYDHKNPKVCCPTTPKVNLLTLPSRMQEVKSEVPQAVDVSSHQNYNLLPQECGSLETTDRIVNGNRTDLFEFPWMALLAYSDVPNDFRCGGTIINSRYILTAAHCIAKKRPIKVRVGEYDYNTETDCVIFDGVRTCAPPYKDIPIERITCHSGFSKHGLTNDISLLRLSTPIPLNQENIRPVCLPVAEARNYNFTGRNVVVTGWGRDSTQNQHSTSSVLLKAELPIVPIENCKRMYKGRKLGDGATLTVDERQLCAGGRSSSDACKGDSGGPLHVATKLFGDTRYVQAGVVSVGPTNCGVDMIPGLYTNVKYFMEWILDNMEP